MSITDVSTTQLIVDEPNLHFARLAPDQVVARTAQALTERGMTAIVAETGEQAKAQALKLIPHEAQVFTAQSMTTAHLGLVHELDETGHYRSVRKILKMMDRKSQMSEMREIMSSQDIVVGSVQAITQEGVVLDVGANAEVRPQYLVQFAHMGSCYARYLLGRDNPRVGLLSIGEEETKGNDLTRDAHRLLRESPLAFVGNLDARGLYSGEADVIVCDGFTGNIALKVSESVVETVEVLLGEVEERRQEVARMLAGVTVTDSALEHAGALIAQARQGSSPARAGGRRSAPSQAAARSLRR